MDPDVKLFRPLSAKLLCDSIARPQKTSNTLLLDIWFSFERACRSLSMGMLLSVSE
jgi:hypothetical protein